MAPGNDAGEVAVFGEWGDERGDALGQICVKILGLGHTADGKQAQEDGKKRAHEGRSGVKTGEGSL